MPIRRRPPRPAPEPTVTLEVAAVARRLGVATGTLRTWDRRYGVGPSAHEAGTRRRYSAADLARLTVMHRLMLEGVAAAEAARAAIETEVDDLPGADQPLLPVPAAPGARPGRRARPGGGRVVATREAGPAARGLARAAMSLDSDACTALLRSSLAGSGAVGTWNDVLLPVLAGVGDRWRSTGSGIEVEHLLSECAEAVLRGAAEVAGRARNARPVLLAALEPEDHRLPLLALAAALAERGVATRSLGARLPPRALVDAVGRTGALAVFLWSQGVAGHGRLPEGGALLAVRPRPAVLLGGPGWDRARGRPGVTVVGDLEAAVTAVLAVVSGRVPAR
jgi:MerR family transcriptional regulator, light-induced transcriptional regulator